MMTRLLCSGTLLCAATASLMAADELITNGDFEATAGDPPARVQPLSYGFSSILKTADAGRWCANPNTGRSFNNKQLIAEFPDASNGVGMSEDNDISESSLIYLIQDGKAHSGSATFSLDLYQLLSLSKDATVQLLGYNGDDDTVDAALTADSIKTPKNSQTEDGTGAVLLSETIAHQNSNLNAWDTQSWTVDLGDGYDYIVLSIGWTGEDVGVSDDTDGALFYLDNISLEAGSAGTPGIPNISAVATSHEAIQLTWDDVSGEAGYEIWRNDVHVDNLPADSTSYSDTGLTANTTYEYRVDAVDVVTPVP
jgi:hypothetical protein